MTVFRKPQFRGERAQTRADQGVFLADNDASCWIDLQEYECLNVRLYPVEEIKTIVVNDGNADHFPIPTCEPTPITTCEAVCPANEKEVGISGCYVLETKHGGDKDIEAHCIQTWENDGKPITDEDGGLICINESFDKLKRFVRLRAIKADAPTGFELKVVRGRDTQ